jgi:Mor family transcriptional regulator
MNNWITGISIDELPALYQEMARLIGIENTIKLAEHFGKQGLYFKSLDCLIRKKKEEYIRENFTGSNHRELARATGYSERWVYEILKQDKDDRQECMF